jgi:hypothetical protein
MLQRLLKRERERAQESLWSVKLACTWVSLEAIVNVYRLLRSVECVQLVCVRVYWLEREQERLGNEEDDWLP